MNDINVSLDGNLSGAIQAVREAIEPEQRKLAKQKKQLENAQLRSAIGKQNAERLREEAAAATEQAEAQRKLAEASKLMSEANLLDVQARKLQAEVDQMYLDMAIKLVELNAPSNLDGTAKIGYIVKILDTLKRDHLISEKITLIGDGSGVGFAT